MKLTKTKANLFLVGVIFLSMLCAPSLVGVQAIEYGLLGGRPANPDPNIENSSAWFIYNLEAGESKEDAIEVMNLFNDPMSIIVYAADSLHSSSGGFALRQYTEPKDEVGSWVRFYTTELPEYFNSIFNNLDKEIISLCSQSKESLTEKLIETEELGEEEEISDDNMSELNKWCEGEDGFEVTLEGKERKTAPFVIRVPEDADVGEHTGGILIQRVDAEDTTTQEGSAVKLTTRVGVRIYQTVPGDIIKNLTLENFEVNKNFKEFDLSRFFFMKWLGKGNEKPEDFTVTSKVANSGNVSVGFEEIITVNDIFFGKRSEEISRNYQVLKSDFFISNYSWESPRFGYFEFSKTIKYDDQAGGQQSIQTSVVKKLILPIREIVTTLLVALLILSIYIGKRVYIKRKYNIDSWRKYIVEEGDDINNLADTHKIDWKILAKVNKIKAPFKLTVGDEILTPSDDEESDDEDSGIGSDEVSEDSGSDIVSGSSIAETLWEDHEKEETTKEITPKDEKKIEDIKEVPKEEEVKDVNLEENKKTDGSDKSEEDVVEEKKKNDEEIMEEYIAKKKLKKLWLHVGLVVIALIVIAYLSFSLGRNTADKEDVVVVKEVPIAEEAPVVQQEEVKEVAQDKEKDAVEEAEKEEVRDPDFSKTNVLVLNGGSVSGAAGKMKEALAASDSSIENIEAENAVGEYSEETIVYYQKDFKAEAEKISKLLAEDYGEIEVMSSEDFPEGESEENIVIIIGEK